MRFDAIRQLNAQEQCIMATGNPGPVPEHRTCLDLADTPPCI